MSKLFILNNNILWKDDFGCFYLIMTKVKIGDIFMLDIY